MRRLLALKRHISIFTTQSFYHPKRFFTPHLHLNDVTAVTEALNLAESSRSSVLGSQVHGQIIKLGLSNDIFSQNNSIKMYSNCGVFADAHKVFDEMPMRNLVSWTLIISGANKNGEFRVALESFVDLIRTGCFMPNEFALGSIMKACISTGAIDFGLSIHCFSVKIGMERNGFVGSSILHMYSKYGGIETCERFFEGLNGSDLGCWNAMVGGYAQCGYGLEAVNTVSSMHSKGVLMDEFTFIHALNACSITSERDFGSQIHGLIVRNGFESATTLTNALMDMYFKTGVNDYAWKLFETMEDKDMASWNTVLAGSSQIAGVERVVSLFADFMFSGLKPNRITFLILFRMCGDLLEVDLGLQFYGLAVRLGLDSKPHVSNCLINMFCRCGAEETARSIFNSLPLRNIQNWNEMIHGYNWNCDREAVKLFTDLWGSGVEPDERTFSCVVEACFKTENVGVGRQVHGIIIKFGFASNGYVCSSLIRGYAKFGFLTDSYAFFDDKMDLVSWGALISTLVEQGHTRTAIGFLDRIKEDGQNPDSFIFGSVLNACASIGSLDLTKSVHGRVFTIGLDTNEHVSSAIIDAYAKSGDITSAGIAFHQSCRFADVALFNTMIMAYANHGRATEAMEVYEMMKPTNLKPSQSTFVSILSACNHAGLVDLGRSLFRSISLDYEMDPSPDNYGCLVDLLSRNGYLEEAKSVIESMPFLAWPGIWRSFLNGCRIHGDVELGKAGAGKLFKMFPETNAGYVLLSKIYCEDGNWEDGLKRDGGDTEASLDKIKRQLASGSGRNLLQGPLLKRSETLRKWNERWVILDPTTGKMEYKIRRNDPNVKGTITFDSNSTIMTSPYNFHGLPKYDNCIIYIATPPKKEYFLCAETPGAARAWVATLHATQLVLRAHKEAVNSLAGNSSAKLGTVSAVVAAANSTALESSKEIEAALQIARRNALGSVMNKTPDGPIMDDLTIMKETLRVKDEELQNLARDIRARDSTIKEIAEKLTETAEAAEGAASAAHTMDEQRRIASSEVERLKKELEKQAMSYSLKLRDSEEKVAVLTKEREQLIKQRDSSHQEALLWRSELAKARERVVILEGAVVRAEEKVRVKEAEAEAAIKEATENEIAARNQNQELLAYINMLQLQLKRQQENTKEVLEERGESCSDADTQPLTKHVHPSEENVDKACLSVSRNIPVAERSLVHPAPAVDQTGIRPIGDGEWNDIEATEARIADVREIATDTEGNSSDIPVFLQPNDTQQPQQEGSAYHPHVSAFRQPDDTQPPEQTTDSYHQP
ncbi:hypothetical protein OSB04_021938 [Centaurea solstitialis]|uniref:PH domain-containing protein n=1 Tax=Centaurea solstitialis TaxID=347529 RepID=A0AA38WEN1_9ASTR|nr:hypothetical protein OSB04_021938 [Centaurea solstitialis]